MKSKFVILAAASLTMLSTGAFAWGVDIPGLGKAGTSTKVQNSSINVSGNKAENIVAGGGSIGVSGLAKGLVGAEASMNGEANANSVNIGNGAEVKDSTVNISGNDAKNVYGIGGTANANSVNIR